jgi:hypothetical protein
MQRSILVGVSLVMVQTLGCSAKAEDKKPEEKPYTLASVAEPSPIATGKPCAYQLSIAPKAPWVLKTETPLKVKLSASSGLTLAKSTLTWDDVVDAKSVAKAVKTGCQAKAAGQHKVDADLTFFLCTEEICQRYVDKVALPVQVQ